ncbi:MAG TPA: 3,4-dihydroxy-2-butanone-4-phosphate synthase [Candidatus Thermoplasmatota archaeon]|nr:3,4-dihydroxy-2-butanone-4-phosphate synthase [Candidatus Thermoplasmatota archaeon]
MKPIEAALAALRRGEPVLLYDADGREEETDMVIASEFATPQAIRRLREEAGGLLCTTVAPEHHRKLDLPYLADLVQGAAKVHPVLQHLLADDIKYDPSRSSFGLTVNLRTTYTGIPDNDRSATIVALAHFLRGVEGMRDPDAQRQFGRLFRSPGHCILLNASEGGLAKRQGHTELSLELARQARLVPSTTICEMLDGQTGKALGKKAAMDHAARKGLVFITGRDVTDAWHSRSARPPTAAVLA